MILEATIHSVRLSVFIYMYSEVCGEGNSFYGQFQCANFTRLLYKRSTKILSSFKPATFDYSTKRSKSAAYRSKRSESDPLRLTLISRFLHVLGVLLSNMLFDHLIKQPEAIHTIYTVHTDLCIGISCTLE